MTLYQKLVFPALKQFDAEFTHEQTLHLLEQAQKWQVGRWMLGKIAGTFPPQKPITLFNLTFPNAIGIAAGFDKDVRVAHGLAQLGFGHIEVGTLTPRPQVGNPRPRIFRLPEDGGVINRMGFPNGGVQGALPRLRQLAQSPRQFVLGVSLGKQKETPLANAAADYIHVMKAVFAYADYLAINISSPNTPGLRELQGGNYLASLLGQLEQENKHLAGELGIAKRPLLVKIAPDLTWAEIDEIIAAASESGVNGIIATNTTLARAGLQSKNQSETGGLSGLPVRERSLAVVRYLAENTTSDLPIIGVGGVRNAVHVRNLLDAGASLVQIYTGLIYEGPSMAGNILRDLG